MRAWVVNLRELRRGRRGLAWLLLGGLAVAFLAWEPARVDDAYRPALAEARSLADTGPLRPIYSFATTDKAVALTFDISWGEKMAPKVLDVLKREGVRATFFLSGPWVRDHADLARRIRAEGHEIQSHGQRHDNFSSLGRDGVVRNLQAAHEILREVTGAVPALVRPPNGDFNDLSLAATRAAGYRTVMWSIDSLDWKNPGVGVISRRVVGMAHPGAVILLHASDSCRQTDAALPLLLAGLREQGYRIGRMDEMLGRYPIDSAGYIHRPGQSAGR